MTDRSAQSDLPSKQPTPCENKPATEQVERLAQILDPIAFELLPQSPTLGQMWVQICRRGAARKHAERALRVGYRLTENQG